MATAMNVAGSRGSTPNSIDCKYRAPAMAPADTDRDPDRREHDAASQHQREHLPSLGAKRHADADLFGALHYRIGEHAVDADCGEQARDAGEDAEHHRVEALSRDRVGDHLLHRRNRVDAGIDVNRARGLTDGGDRRFGVAACS